ncbi:MAG: hypothetical protein M3Q79_02385, partial [bacterium]|nr:hypothetical protein [bacterium]
NVALLISWPASLVLRAILDVSVLFAKVPYASVITYLPLAGMLGFYTALIVIIILLKKFRTNSTEVMVK